MSQKRPEQGCHLEEGAGVCNCTSLDFKKLLGNALFGLIFSKRAESGLRD